MSKAKRRMEELLEVDQRIADASKKGEARAKREHEMALRYPPHKLDVLATLVPRGRAILLDREGRRVDTIIDYPWESA